MNLVFMTKWANGEPTYFVEKIWAGLRNNEISTRSEELFYSENAKKFLYSSGFEPKIHTIREDKNNRWRVGNKIHFVINNRQPNRFQFAPVIECTGVQTIEFFFYRLNTAFEHLQIKIDGRYLSEQEMIDLSVNDGFKSLTDFYDYFLTGWNGEDDDYYKKMKLIHWTNKSY